ncbi:uncharacterized protein PHACADRAFT_260745 [Phanerochaete carnosa HHB-10118-sp]|uniref:Membrane insertase YidC/Oxa/ALB C-terminal domain-containing protein n=1 Tax=Phanerochaete carnosa (strain HHB-10118-sp) TaxID=650164 RepID=K5WPY7_PHACS|nr:uncharacterized protein PHACADRAFT_260745 [Phanerochaete carnosa HHB-10118-sp]EKM52397.1 hypothetical protein PHACADRAFT_260745 [Phanerochaete carnosa HHB-10118-sp]
MILRGAYCAGGRASVLGAGARLPRHFASSSQVRLLSLGGVQRATPSTARKSPYALPGGSRNFWWSSSKVSTAEPSAATSPESPVLAQDSAGAVAVTEQSPAEAAQLLESTNALDTAPIIDTTPVAEIVQDTIATPLSSSALDTVAQITPLQYGDLAAMGLASWSPAGLCQWFLEVSQVASGLPWFWTIVGATVVSRLIVFPFAVKSIRNAARMAPHQAEFEKLREEINKARISKDMVEMQRAVMKQQMLYKKIGVSLPGMVLPPFAQIPVTLGMFFGVKKMCDLPVPQLKQSGVDFWQDLTVPDPMYVLPALATAGMNVGLTLGMRDMAAAEHTPHLINGLRVLSTVGLLFMVNLPAGVLVHILTGTVCMSLQSTILRLPAVRSALDIPQRPANFGVQSTSMVDTWRYIQKWWAKKREDAILEAHVKAQRRR